MDGAAEAHRSALICALLGVVGTAIGAAGFWSISGPALRGLQAAGFLVNATGLWAASARREPTRAFSNAVFLLVLVPTVAMTWLIDDARAARGVHWVPYEPAKLSALTLAIIAPPGWTTGVVAILGFIGSALVHHAVLGPELRARMSAGEPFGIIAYGVFALIVLGFRQRNHAVYRELETARREKAVLERLAGVAMALRDLANTPLQTLELVRQALLAGDARPPLQAERMEHALSELRKLNEIVAPYQGAVSVDVDVERLLKVGGDAGAAAPGRARRARRLRA
jgi:hypothetical protein